MLHEPAAPVAEDTTIGYKTRLGTWMFLAYLLFYAGFVGCNPASPSSMEAIVLLGMNLATVYGFALIVVALILAVIYDQLCRAQEQLAADAARVSAEGARD